jgi:hypothetical protein
MAFLYKEAFRSFINDGIFLHIASCTNKDELVKAGVEENFAEAVVNNKVKDYLESFSRYKLEEMSTAWDQKFLVKISDLFLNQTTRCLRVAGFKGGILLIDDIENLTDKSTRAEIENFIKDFGIAFFRAGNEVTENNFYTTILTTHQQSATDISQAWTVAGLSSSFPLAHGGRSSLLARKPDIEQSIDIVIKYLDYYRNDSFKPPHEFYPFKKDAIESVVRESDFHPRRFLSRFNRIIVEALSKNIKEIDAEFIEKVPEVEEQEEESLGIEEIR